MSFNVRADKLLSSIKKRGEKNEKKNEPKNFPQSSFSHTIDVGIAPGLFHHCFKLKTERNSCNWSYQIL
jgi:hypothetical protein